MPLKTLWIILGSIALLTASMLLLLEPPGAHKPQPEAAETTLAGKKSEMTGTGGAETPATFRARITQASDNDEFKPLLEEISESAPGAGNRELLEFLFDHWIKTDIGGALDGARQLQQSQNGSILLEYTIVAGGKISFPVVFNWLSEKIANNDERKALLFVLYFGVGKESPALALTFVDLLNDPEQKDQIMRSLVEQWAAKDLRGALSWLSSQEELSKAMQELQKSLAARAGQENSELSGESIRNMEAGQEKSRLAREYAANLAKTDVEAATAWARSLNDPESYKVAMSAVFEAWLLQEPDKKKILDQLLAESDSELRDFLINEVALDIAAESPEDLAAVLDKVPESAQPDIAAKVANFWQVRNPEEALNWVNGLKPGPARDRASRAVLENLLSSNQDQEARSLIANIRDRDVRFASSRRLIESLNTYDSEKANKILQELQFLNEQEKQSILASIRNKPD